MRRCPLTVAAAALTVLGGCRADARAATRNPAADSTLLMERAARFQEQLANPDSGGVQNPIARWSLPASLSEISGLVLTADGRLLAHQDSRGKVFEIDYRRGVIVKEFNVGEPTVHGDFEAIATIGDTVILLASDGVLYSFREGGNGKGVPFMSYDTGLGERCEFEGLAYEPSSKALLLACKKVHVKALKDSLIIFRLPAAAATGGVKPGRGSGKLSYLAVPLSRIIGANAWTTLHPSDITIDPFNGNYLIVASIEHALFEITPAGALVFARPLPPGHDQAEGVALTKDSLLIISDEAKGGPALITLYRWRM